MEEHKAAGEVSAPVGEETAAGPRPPEVEAPRTKRKGGGAPAEGTALGREALAHHNERLLRAIDKMREVEQSVELLLEEQIEEAKDGEPAGPESEGGVTKIARRFLLVRALEAVADMPTEAMGALTPDRLAGLIVRLEQTRISSGRLNLQWRRGFDTAKEAILSRIEREFDDRPDLLAQVRRVADEAAERAEAGEEEEG